MNEYTIQTLAKLAGISTRTSKFKGLKNQMVDENDRKYGEEVKQRWGEKAWKESNKKFMGLTPKQFEDAARLDAEFKAALKEAYETNQPEGEAAQRAVSLHKEWLMIFWPEYSKEAHLGLAEMYINDDRFHHYFDNNVELAKFFKDAVKQQKSA